MHFDPRSWHIAGGAPVGLVGIDNIYILHAVHTYIYAFHYLWYSNHPLWLSILYLPNLFDYKWTNHSHGFVLQLETCSHIKFCYSIPWPLTTLPETNSSHLKITPWKRRFLLETIIFRCALLVSGSVVLFSDGLLKPTNQLGKVHMSPWPTFQVPSNKPIWRILLEPTSARRRQQKPLRCRFKDVWDVHLLVCVGNKGRSHILNCATMCPPNEEFNGKLYWNLHELSIHIHPINGGKGEYSQIKCFF